MLGLATHASLRHTNAESERLVQHTLLEEQGLIAQAAAERLGSLIRDVQWRLEVLAARPGPIEPHAAWLADTDLERRGAILFVHDSAGRVIAEPPGLDEDKARMLRQHAHRPQNGRWNVDEVAVCPICLQHGRALSLTHAVSGQDGLYLSAAIDMQRTYARLFAPLAGSHDGYVWVLRNDGTIVASPDSVSIGQRPFESNDIDRSLRDVLLAMRRGDKGEGRYVWRDDRGARDRLIAYAPTPDRPDLSVAYSVDQSSIVARTRELHRRSQWTIGTLVVSFGFAILLVAFLSIRGARRRGEATTRLAHVERLSTIGMLTAGIGHEMRNPLTSVAINIEMAERALLESDPDAEDALISIKDARMGVDRMREILDTLRHLGRKQEARGDLDLREVVQAALLLAKPRLRTVETRVELPDPLPVSGASGELTQVVLNLLLNAEEALSARDRGTVTIRGQRSEQWVELQVEDNGPGVPAELRESIFEAFNTSKKEGTGLGLAISRDIVERHGGTIRCGGESGHTSFYLRLSVRPRASLRASVPVLSHS